MDPRGSAPEHEARGELLAAYLSGDLAPDEVAEVEALLRDDAGARRTLEGIRRADAALTDLPEVAPSAEFSSRLRAAVAEEIGATPVDELAARRSAPAWTRRLGIAAAAAGVLGVVAIGIGQLGSSDVDPTSADSAMITSEAAPADGARGSADTPIEITDTDHTQETLLALPTTRREGWLNQLELQLSRRADISAVQEEQLDYFGLRMSAEGPVASFDAPPEAQSDAAQSGTTADGGATGGADEAQRTDPAAAFTDVRRCLPQLLDGARGPAIPLHAEVARFEGEPVVIYVLAVEDPATSGYDRLELFVVARSDCLTRYFAQL